MNKEELRSIFFEKLAVLIDDIEFGEDCTLLYGASTGRNFLACDLGLITEEESCLIEESVDQLWKCKTSDSFMSCKDNLIKSLKNELK